MLCNLLLFPLIFSDYLNYLCAKMVFICYFSVQRFLNFFIDDDGWVVSDCYLGIVSCLGFCELRYVFINYNYTRLIEFTGLVPTYLYNGNGIWFFNTYNYIYLLFIGYIVGTNITKYKTIIL